MRISLTTLIILSPYDSQAMKAIQCWANLEAYRSTVGNIQASFDRLNGFRTQLIDYAENESRAIYNKA